MLCGISFKDKNISAVSCKMGRLFTLHLWACMSGCELAVTFLPVPMCFPHIFSFSLLYTYYCVLYKWSEIGEAVRCTNSSTLSADHCKKLSWLCVTQHNSMATIGLEQILKQCLHLGRQNSLLYLEKLKRKKKPHCINPVTLHWEEISSSSSYSQLQKHFGVF